MTVPTWLDRVFGAGIQQLAVGGAPKPTEPIVNLIAGSGVTINAVDNPSSGRTDTTISSGAAGGGSLFGAAASRPAANSVPANTLYFASDTGVISASNGSTWTVIPTTAGSSFADQGTIVAPPLAATWSNVNFSNTTLVNSGTTTFPTVFLLNTHSLAGGDSAACSFQTIPGSAGAGYTLTAGIRTFFPANPGTALCGICVSDGTKVICLSLTYGSSGGVFQVIQRNSATSFHANAYSTNWAFPGFARAWLKMQVAGGNRTYAISFDGADYAVFLSEADTTWISNDETLAGIFVNPINVTPSVGITLESFALTSP
jgi:hypothetical protein